MKKLRKRGFMNAEKLVNQEPYSVTENFFKSNLHIIFYHTNYTTTDTQIVNQAQL